MTEVEKSLEFKSTKSELAELYHNCYLYVHGHQFGGTNPTMLKALAYGCAILALDTVFNKEMLDEVNYGIFFTKESNNLAKVIDEIEKNDSLLETLRGKVRERIRSNYTWEKICSQYIDLFNDLCRR